jgi:hypothetical protein
MTDYMQLIFGSPSIISDTREQKFFNSPFPYRDGMIGDVKLREGMFRAPPHFYE